MKILLVEDEDLLAKYIARALRTSGHVVDISSDGSEALDKILSEDYSVVVLDVILPKMDGLSICEAVRKAGKSVPVIFLSSKDEHADRIAGLSMGGDDYLTKPFHIEELKARLEALLRRVGTTPKATIIFGSLVVDINSRTVRIDDDEVVLRPKEFDVLAYLLHRRGTVVSREELLQNVWSGTRKGSSSNRVDVCIRNLRSKIDTPYGTDTIKTRHGSGYQIV